MRDDLEIDSACIHIVQTWKAKISKLRLQLGRKCSLSVSPHGFTKPIGQEMFFDSNGVYAD